MSTVAIIPARGGSKGIPGKNLINFCGKPLLAWSIIQAHEARVIDAVYVTSDDPHILAVAEQYGACGIRRPSALSTDRSTSEEALTHALEVIEEEAEMPDVVVFLQATSPLRTPDDINGACEAFDKAQADALFSMSVLDDFTVWKQGEAGLQGLTFDPENREMRQDRSPLLLENGNIYVFSPHVLKSYNNRLGGKIATFEMLRWKSFEIDTLEDLELCEYYFKQHLQKYWERHTSLETIKCSDLDLIVYDFDGVMTDNLVYVSETGIEMVAASRSDGMGVSRIRSLGIPQLILSTETNLVVQARAKKLKLDVIQACEDKRSALAQYCEEHDYELAKVVFVGNDLNDLEAMKIVGYPIAPQDARAEIRAMACMITSTLGGQGVIRELSDRIID